MTQDVQEKRDAVLRASAEYWETQVKGSDFIPGETSVPVSGKVLDGEDLKNLIDSSLDMWLTAGRFAEQFETDLAKSFGMRASRATVSGSAANLLAFSALTSPKLKDKRLKPGDEVITVATGFPTTVAPIVQYGCVPVFIDIELGTHNVDVNHLESALSSKTRAIMIAHTLGNPFDVVKVKEFAKAHNLYLIEDCCDAFGAKVEGKHVGTFGSLATASFYPAHHITTGEGGAVISNNLALMTLVESFRDWGRDCYCKPGVDNTCNKRFDWQLGDLPYGFDHKYIYSHIGYNMKMTDMQAAVGCSQLQKLDGFVEKRKINHKRMYDGFKNNGLQEFFHLPESMDSAEPSWFGFLATLRSDAPFSRRDFLVDLDKKKIGSRLVFAGNLIHQPAFKDVNYRKIGDLKNSDIAMNQSFWLGVWPGLEDQQIDYVIDSVVNFVKENK